MQCAKRRTQGEIKQEIKLNKIAFRINFGGEELSGYGNYRT